MVSSSESVEEFLSNSGIEPEHSELVSVIREVLSKWTGIEPSCITSSTKPKKLHCRDWDSTEFMWDVLHELDLDLPPCDADFPDLFPCMFSFFMQQR